MNVYSKGKHVAVIRRLERIADGFDPETPWVLLHNTGRTDRFANQTDAKDEARKSYPAPIFKRA